MPTLTIRKLDPGVYKRISGKAKSNKRSLEAEVRAILAREAPPLNVDELIEDLKAFRARTKLKLSSGQTSVTALQKMRENK
jgi:plasmid stability protein